MPFGMCLPTTVAIERQQSVLVFGTRGHRAGGFLRRAPGASTLLHPKHLRLWLLCSVLCFCTPVQAKPTPTHPSPPLPCPKVGEWLTSTHRTVLSQTLQSYLPIWGGGKAYWWGVVVSGLVSSQTHVEIELPS